MLQEQPQHFPRGVVEIEQLGQVAVGAYKGFGVGFEGDLLVLFQFRFKGINHPVNDGVKLGGLKPEAEYDTLKNIISVFNQQFAQFFEDNPNVDQKDAEQTLAVTIPQKMEADAETLQSIKNSDKDNARITSNEKVDDLMEALLFTHTEIYKKYKNDLDFQKRYKEFVFEAMWGKANRSGRVGAVAG